MTTLALNSLISLTLFIVIIVPAILVSNIVVPIMLFTKWDGKTTIFGNAKWGRANNHFAYATKGYWQEFNWLVLRNPVNNLVGRTLAVTRRAAHVIGNPNIGDKIAGGFYRVTMGKYWEYYWIKPYNLFGRRCIRVRIGWKIYNSDTPSAFVFAINPFKAYIGI